MALWMRCVFSLSTMQSRMKAVATALRPPARGRGMSARGIRRCEMTAFSTRGKLQAHLLLLVRRIHRDDAVDRLGRVERVQRREHEVAGLGREQRRFDRLEVAHFADENDVGILPQRAAQRLRERARVDRHFALVDDRSAVAVQELDRDPRPSSRASSACC